MTDVTNHFWKVLSHHLFNTEPAPSYLSPLLGSLTCMLYIFTLFLCHLLSFPYFPCFVSPHFSLNIFFFWAMCQIIHWVILFIVTFNCRFSILFFPRIRCFCHQTFFYPEKFSLVILYSLDLCLMTLTYEQPADLFLLFVVAFFHVTLPLYVTAYL